MRFDHAHIGHYMRCLLLGDAGISNGAVMTADRAAVMLFVDEPIFNALCAENMVTGASDLPNLHLKM